MTDCAPPWGKRRGIVVNGRGNAISVVAGFAGPESNRLRNSKQPKHCKTFRDHWFWIPPGGHRRNCRVFPDIPWIVRYVSTAVAPGPLHPHAQRQVWSNATPIAERLQ